MLQVAYKPFLNIKNINILVILMFSDNTFDVKILMKKYLQKVIYVL